MLDTMIMLLIDLFYLGHWDVFWITPLSFWPALTFFLTLLCSLALQDPPGSSCIFHTQVLESATSLDSLDSFYRRTVFRNGSRLFVFPQIHMLNLKPSIMTFEHGDFERRLGGEDGALIKETPVALCPICHMRTEQKDGHVWARKWVFTRYLICWCLDLGLSSVKNCEKLIFVV